MASRVCRRAPIDTRWVFDRPAYGDIFRIYVERGLAPTLEPGHAAFIGNLRRRKADDMRESNPDAHLQRSPPCFSNLSPVGQAFANLERRMRKAHV